MLVQFYNFVSPNKINKIILLPINSNVQSIPPGKRLAIVITSSTIVKQSGNYSLRIRAAFSPTLFKMQAPCQHTRA